MIARQEHVPQVPQKGHAARAHMAKAPVVNRWSVSDSKRDHKMPQGDRMPPPKAK